MLNSEDSKTSLKKLFRKHKVLDLQKLSQALGTTSRMSIFRRLQLIGYYSSYTHKGAYYTLIDIPRFDGYGLWFFQGIGFTNFGTLKAAVIELVEHSEAGYTHRELEALLHIRLHNTLLILVREKRIERKRIEKQFVYCSTHPRTAAEQEVQRTKRLSLEVDSRVALSEEIIIEVLLEIIRAGQVLIGPELVRQRLMARQIPVNIKQIEQVYKNHGLEAEKKMPHSTS